MLQHPGIQAAAVVGRDSARGKELVAFVVGRDGPAPLAAELRMAVGMKGRRQAALYLDNALGELRKKLGERDELGLLASEIERLEVSYG